MRIKKKIEEAQTKLLEYLKQGITPAEISFAVALGIFIAFVPMVGVHSLMALLFAWMLRVNPVIVFVGTQISNPFTFPFQLIISAQTGHLVMYGGFLPLDWSQDIDWVNSFLWPTLLGSLILAVVFSFVVYFGTYRFLKRKND